MSKNLSSADGSFLGFLFQIERVLLWLSEGTQGRVVGIETDDDIVIRLNNKETIESIYEQAKNAQSNRIPFSDQSEDLWKTLSIWIKACNEKRINLESARFSAVTNKILPASRLLVKISETNGDKTKIKTIVKELKETAVKLSSKNKKYGEIVINCDNAVLEKIISQISVSDGSYHHNRVKFKTQLKANLSIGDKLPFDYIYNSLLGAITEQIITFWRNKEEAWIKVDSFNNLFNDLVAQYKNKSFLEQATELIPVNKRDIDSNAKKIYVEQLKEIGCDEKEVLEAVHDYLRAQSEKSRYAKEFEITKEQFEKYYADLKQNWISISRPRFKINSQQLTMPEIGYQVFYEVTSYKGKLNNQEPEQSYTYKGAYHFLSDTTELGWHPEWEKKFKKNSK